MAAPAYDKAKPDFANPVDSDLAQVRDNEQWLMIAAAASGYILPAWTTVAVGSGSPENLAEPATITMTHSDGRKMKWTLTWSSGKVTTVLWQFDKGLGGGLETLTGGTATLTYDGSNNWSGATTA